MNWREHSAPTICDMVNTEPNRKSNRNIIMMNFAVYLVIRMSFFFFLWCDEYSHQPKFHFVSSHTLVANPLKFCVPYEIMMTFSLFFRSGAVVELINSLQWNEFSILLLSVYFISMGVFPFRKSYLIHWMITSFLFVKKSIQKS